MKYESELIREILEMEGHKSSSLHYESECIEEWIESVRGAYPKLCDYEGEWLNYYLENGGIGEFPYESVMNVTDATIYHTVPIPFKSAILKGQTLVNKMVNATYRGNLNDLHPNSNMEFINTSGLARNILPLETSVFEPNKTYTIILFLDEIEDGGLDMTHTLAGKNATLKIGANKTLYTTPSRLDNNNYSHNTQIQCNFKARYMILEGDHTQEDITYFEGMSSVKTSQTLVNIKGEETNVLPMSGYSKYDFLIPLVKKNTDYLIKYDTALSGGILAIGFLTDNSAWSKNLEEQPNIGTIRLNSGEYPNYFRIIAEPEQSVAINNLMIIEYQQGMENWDIPYFEGMQSVKMPVLTTIGKNLFDENQVPEHLSWGDNVKKTNVKENTAYVYSSSPYTGYVSFKFYDNNDNEIRQGISIESGTSFTTPPNTSYLKCHTANTSLVQIEEGTQATPYEPYKSNILTVNEEVELRGIGDVQDTLNCLTGEVIERIGEVVLDGSEDWKDNSTEGGIRYSLILKNATPEGVRRPIISDYFPYSSLGHEYPSAFVYGGSLFVYLEETTTLEDLKIWLATNKPTVQYQLKTEPIKTVELTIADQEGESVNQLKGMNETTHIETNGTPIAPLFSGEIPVEAIEQNLNSFIEQEGEQNE